MSRLLMPPMFGSSGFVAETEPGESEESSKLGMRLWRDKPDGLRGVGDGVFGVVGKGVAGALSSLGAGGGW